MADNRSDPGNAISGALLGALVGGGLGLGTCIVFFDAPPLFTGDTILIGAFICGTSGYFLGEDFIDWLKENWWWFCQSSVSCRAG